MAKGQMRSNKEKKKPKQNKPKKGAAAAPASGADQIKALFHKGDGDRDRRRGGGTR